MESLQSIVERAQQTGTLSPAMEAEIDRIRSQTPHLSPEETAAFDRLSTAIEAKQISKVPYKKFVNVLEDVVLVEVSRQLTGDRTISVPRMDMGDITAHTLNRLPALYATTNEGANYQREKVRQEWREVISQRVSESLRQLQEQPDPHPSRTVLGMEQGDDLANQVRSFLKSVFTHRETSQAEDTEIATIVERALRQGLLSPSMEADISRIEGGSARLRVDQQQALDRLMQALKGGEVKTLPYKRFVNALEQPVLVEISRQMDRLAPEQIVKVDLGDACAFTLNRLPALYATTSEGIEFQRQKIEAEWQPQIQKEVMGAIDLLQDRPHTDPRRTLLGMNNIEQQELVADVRSTIAF